MAPLPETNPAFNSTRKWMVGSADLFPGWWLNHPSEKYARQNGNLPQIGMKIKKCLKPPPSFLLRWPTLPETNIAHENPIFPGKYHQNDGFSTAMLVYESVFSGANWLLVSGFVYRTFCLLHESLE